MKAPLASGALFLLLAVSGPATAYVYTQPLSMADSILMNPFYVENAFLREETFGPHVRYWQPSQPNVEGIVMLKFDVPFKIQNALLHGSVGITAYTVGSDANYDPNAATYLDVSPDNVNWTNVASQTNMNAVGSGIGGPWDLSSILTGSNVAYVRARLFMTTNYSGFGTSQFMRQGEPYVPGHFTATGNLCCVTLDFDSPVINTLADNDGLGTGFTHRLPGTGGALPANDPNMDLTSVPGKLRLTSTHSDFNQTYGGVGNNLPILEAPGVFVPDLGSKDVFVKAVFEDVSVPNGNDQLMLYAGVNENKILRAGIHQTNVYVMSQNNGAGDINTFTGPNAFATGDDIEVTLSRQAGLWSLSWNNLTTGINGSLPAVSIPWLDAEPNLYFGVHAANAGFVPGTNIEQPFVAQIDKFSVTCVPEPSSIAAAFGNFAVTWLIRRRARKLGRYSFAARDPVWGV